MLIPEKTDLAIRDMLQVMASTPRRPASLELVQAGSTETRALGCVHESKRDPGSAIGAVIRNELVNARDAPFRHAVPADECANQLGLLRFPTTCDGQERFL